MKKLVFFLLLTSVPVLATVTVLFNTSPAGGGVTRYISTTGDDVNNTCAESTNIATPKRSFKGANGALACMASGDTLIVRGGTYTTENDIGIPGSAQVPSGVNDTQHTTIRAETGETVIIRPAGGTGVLFLYSNSFITIQDLDFDGINIGGHIVYQGRDTPTDAPGHHIKFIRCVARNADAVVQFGVSGFAIGSDQDGPVDTSVQLINCSAFNNGASGLGHGVYLTGQNNIVDGGTFSNNAGHGVHVYAHDIRNGNDNSIVRNATIFNNGTSGVGVYDGDNIRVYNNAIYANGGAAECPTGVGCAGVKVGLRTVTARIYSNTSYSNTGHGILVVTGGTAIPTQTFVQNNIAFANAQANILDQGDASTVGNNTTVDPSFVNAATFDFHLLPGSVAIGGGLNLSTFFTTDKDGNNRTVPWDIGAYETTTTATITLLEPAPTQIWTINTRQDFRWTSTGSISNVKITINRGQGTENIVTTTPNDGLFSWRVTGTTNSNTVTARVENALDSSVVGTNPSPFVIKFHDGGDYEKIISDNTTGANVGTFGTEDTRLRQSMPTINFGSDVSLSVHKNAVGDHANALLRFDGLDKAVPTEAVVTGASVILFLGYDTTPPTTRTLTLRKVLRNWIESQATWNEFITGSSWTTAGALGFGSDISSIVSGTITWNAFGLLTVNTAQIKTDVQSWSNLSTVNNGWMIERTDGQDDGALDGMASSENTDTAGRPALKVQYSVTPRPPENLRPIP